MATAAQEKPVSPEIPGRNFEDKLGNINRIIATARADYEKAAFLHGEGKNGLEQVEAAEAAIRTLESRRRALIAGNAEATRRDEAARRAAKRERDLEDAQALRDLVAEMEDAFTAGIDGIIAQAPHFAAVKSARERAMLIASRHADAYRDKVELGDARRAVLVDLNRERWMIDGALYRAGLGGYGVGSKQAMMQPTDKEPADALIFAVREITSLASRLEQLSEDD